MRILLITSCIISGCKSDPTGTPAEKYITGTVRDLNGQPFMNAYINMFYSSIVPTFLKGSKTLPTTSFEFGVPHAGFLRVTMENYIHENVIHLFADSVDQGTNEITWDGHDDDHREVYSDCYWVVATLDGVHLSTHKFLIATYQYDAPNPAAFVKTNGLGRFSIPYSRLPLTETFTIVDPNTGAMREVKIGPTDRIYAFTSTAYGFDSVTYSTSRELTIVLSQKK